MQESVLSLKTLGDESQSTNKELGFRVLLSEHDAQLSLTLA